MDCQGQVVVANYLANMSKKGIKGAMDTELEMEILKFFKKSLSNKVRSTLPELRLMIARRNRFHAKAPGHSRTLLLADIAQSAGQETRSRDSRLLLPLGRGRRRSRRAESCVARIGTCGDAP